MNLKLLLIGVAALTALLAFSGNEAEPTAKTSPKTIIRCGPDWATIARGIEENDIPPVPGAGRYTWKISTGNDSAQFYFNQGISMYYCFHIIEAMASFKKAQRFDPSCAMLHWAEALAYGPNINDIGYAASPEALAAIDEAVRLSGTGSLREKMLIEAQRVRYSADSTVSRQTLNQLYADKMKEAYQRYATDADVAALYADALMLQHPWDLWKQDGTPKPWTPAIQQVLEKLLAASPDHPGANHYYIHVMEPSPYAARALPSADRLGKLTPGLSHTVHMPSHIYLRTGQYGKGVSVNETAINSYKSVLRLYPPAAGADFLYSIHNLHMQTNNAMLGGMSAYSVKSAGETVNSIPPDYLAAPGAMGNYIQYIHSTPLFVAARFGRWKDLLALPKPSTELIYANLLYAFGRGLAFAAQSDIGNAKNELSIIKSLSQDSVLMLPLTPFSPAIDGARIAYSLLEGTIALQEKNYEKAIAAYRQAVSVEDNMVYNEPRDWLLSPRHYLGNAYLRAGDFIKAEIVFKEDLRYNNENIWALQGLYDAVAAQKKAPSVIERVRKRLDAVKKMSDLRVLSPIIL